MVTEAEEVLVAALEVDSVVLVEEVLEVGELVGVGRLLIMNAGFHY